jgi:hypothetical protein
MLIFHAGVGFSSGEERVGRRKYLSGFPELTVSKKFSVDYCIIAFILSSSTEALFRYLLFFCFYVQLHAEDTLGCLLMILFIHILRSIVLRCT